MTQFTISVVNEAKYKALLAFIEQEGDIFLEKQIPQKKHIKTQTMPKIQRSNSQKADLSQFCGMLKPSQTITEIDAALAEIRQEWERNF